MKKTLLTFCIGALALGATAQNFKLGEAFAYDFKDWKWFGGYEEVFKLNSQWPADVLEANASLADNTGLGMVWFYGDAFAANCPDMAACDAQFPSVESPWNPGEYDLKMQVKPEGWWAYGNFNFALPQMDKLSRIRVVYRVDPEGFERFEHANPFHVWLNNTSEKDDHFKAPIFEESVNKFWDEPGFRVVDLYYELPDERTYLALMTDAGGITVNASRVPLYVEEISVVPVDLLGETDKQSGDVNIAIEQEAPARVVIGGEGSIDEVAAASKVAEGIYDLQGRKVAKAGKGLYIINGVKTLVK